MAGPRHSIRLIATVATAALVASCSGVAAPAAPSTPTQAAASAGAATSAPPGGSWPATVPDAWLVVGRPAQPNLDVIEASTAESLMQLPPVVPDLTWGHLLEATPEGDRTVVRRLDIASGVDDARIVLDGHWRLPTIGSDPASVGLSVDRSTTALVEDAADATSSAARNVSRFMVVDLSRGRAPKLIELPGSFEFDAISPDGGALFVVEHLDAAAGGHYQVRVVDVASGRLQDYVIVDKTKPDEPMAGWAIEQQRLDSGIVLTVYRGAEHPFIHALETVHAGAVCIDLPATRQDDADAAADWGLARSPDGRTVYAVNATIGVAVDVDPVALSIRRTSTIAPASAAIVLAKFGHQDAGATGRRVVVSPDGRRIFAANRSGIVELAASDLSATRRLLSGTRIDALGITPDGKGLFALRHSDGRVVRLDVTTGAVVAEVPGSGYDRLLAVVPWEP